jgi:hypothetical protein
MQHAILHYNYYKSDKHLQSHVKVGPRVREKSY